MWCKVTSYDRPVEVTWLKFTHWGGRLLGSCCTVGLQHQHHSTIRTCRNILIINKFRCIILQNMTYLPIWWLGSLRCCCWPKTFKQFCRNCHFVIENIKCFLYSNFWMNALKHTDIHIAGTGTKKMSPEKLNLPRFMLWCTAFGTRPKLPSVNIKP